MSLIYAERNEKGIKQHRSLIDALVKWKADRERRPILMLCVIQLWAAKVEEVKNQEVKDNVVLVLAFFFFYGFSQARHVLWLLSKISIESKTTMEE